MFRPMPRAGLIAICAAAVLAGCSDDDPAKPAPPKAKLDTPEAVLEKLEEAYVQRDPASYDSLIWAGAGADTFCFEFSDQDYWSGEVPESWGRADEMASATNMLTSERVTSVDLHLGYGASYADTSNVGQTIIDITDVTLTVIDQPPGGPDPTTYLIRGQRARFRFMVWWVDAEGDSIWRILHWKDRADGAKHDEQRSWGALKSLYR